MPRLPVSPRKTGPGTPKPPTVRFGGFELLGALALFAVWLLGAGWLARALLVDVGCLDLYLPWRGQLGEALVCSLGAGPRGWLYLGYLALFPLGFGAWLRRRLHRDLTR